MRWLKKLLPHHLARFTILILDDINATLTACRLTTLEVVDGAVFNIVEGVDAIYGSRNTALWSGLPDLEAAAQVEHGEVMYYAVIVAIPTCH